MTTDLLPPTPTPRPANSTRWDARQRQEALCDEFESAWQHGRAPTLEDYVARVPLAEQADLLRELIELDVFYRRQRGESVQRGDYRHRFAALEDGSVSITDRGAGFQPAEPAGSATPTTSSERQVENLPNGRFGYEILSELGRGGMGVVYLARQVRLKRLVALKMILAGELASFEERLRFRREAETAARLQHPHIVQVYDVGEHDGHAYLAMEYVGGGTLARWMDGRPQAPREAAALMETLARAIQHAHEQGVVHRDLKPANVLLTEANSASRRLDANELPVVGSSQRENVTPTSARSPMPQSNDAGVREGVSPLVVREATQPTGGLTPSRSPDLQLVAAPIPVARRDDSDRTLSDVPKLKIADFGLAKLLGQEISMTQSGAVMGTPSYMAPEAAGAGPIGAPADIYSLGAILYEALTGHPPFRGANFADTIEQLKTQEPVTPRSLQPKVPRDLETICLKCLQKEPRKRFVSAESLADDLRRFLDGEAITARPIGVIERSARWMNRHPGPAVALVGTALTALLVLGLSLFFNAKLSVSLSETETQSLLLKRQRDETATQRDEVVRKRDELAAQQAVIVEERNKAEAQRALAETQKTEAERQKLEADKQRDEAGRQKSTAEFSTYTSEMLLADRYLRDSRVSAADELLSRHRPLVGMPDRRGFEWFHLWAGCHREDWTLDPAMGPVTDAMPSPDGKWLVLCGNNGSIVVWDVERRTDRFILKGPEISPPKQRPISSDRPSAAFTPDGKVLATCDGDIRLWNVATGQELTVPGQPLQSKGRCIGFSVTGFTLAVGSTDGFLTLWTVHNQKQFHRWKVSSVAIDRVVFSPDRSTIATVDTNSSIGRARIWDIHKEKVLHEIPNAATSSVIDVAFTRDAQRVVFSDGAKSSRWRGGHVRVKQTGTFADLWSVEIPTDCVSRVAFSADGQTLWGGSASGVIRRWHADTGQEQPPLSGHTKRISAMYMLVAGDKLITASDDRVVKQWDVRLTSEPRVWPAPQGDSLERFVVSADGHWLASSGAGRMTLSETATGRSVDWPAEASADRPVQFSADNRLLLTWNREALSLWDVANRNRIATLTCAEMPLLNKFTMSHDGRWIVAIAKASQLFAWDSSSGRRLEDFPRSNGQYRYALALSPDASRLAVSITRGNGSYVEFWKTDWPTSAIANDAAAAERSATKWLDDQPLWTSPTGGNFQRASALKFSTDGRSLILGANGGWLERLDLDTHKAEIIATHDAPISWLDTDESGQTVFSASLDGMVKLTDVARKRELFVLQGLTPGFVGFDWSPQARTVVTAVKSGAVTFWKAPPEAPTYQRNSVELPVTPGRSP